jgi:GWxTD domain-containing protein
MKSLVRTFLILSVICLPFGQAAGQLLQPAERFRLSLDASRFRGGDDEHMNIEFYYSIPQKGLVYKKDSTGWRGGADVGLFVFSADSCVLADRWLVPRVMQDTAALAQNINLVGNYAAQLPRGQYRVKLIGKDVSRPAVIDSVVMMVPVQPFATVTPALSDVEFATSIRKGTEGAQFYKNTLEVIPNVGGVYGENQHCFFYLEAYNLLVDPKRTDYIIRTSVLDAVGREVMARERQRKNVAESSVLIDEFSIEMMKSGTYTLYVALLDTGRKMVSTTGRKFFVYNPSLGVDSSLLNISTSLPMVAFVSMDEPEIDREFSACRYVAQGDEKSQYAKLAGADAKRKFMSDFWRKRPAGLREEYLSRVAYATANYPVGNQPGYQTDRGRVHIVYGPPDDVERHPNESDMRPYEIWTYHNIQGGVMFVFVLRNVGGQYELVHSTHRDELQDANWDRVGISR